MPDGLLWGGSRVAMTRRFARASPQPVSWISHSRVIRGDFRPGKPVVAAPNRPPYDHLYDSCCGARRTEPHDRSRPEIHSCRSVRSSRATGVAAAPTVSGPACAPAPDGPFWPPAGARVARSCRPDGRAAREPSHARVVGVPRHDAPWRAGGPAHTRAARPAAAQPPVTGGLRGLSDGRGCCRAQPREAPTASSRGAPPQRLNAHGRGRARSACGLAAIRASA